MYAFVFVDLQDFLNMAYIDRCSGGYIPGSGDGSNPFGCAEEGKAVKGGESGIRGNRSNQSIQIIQIIPSTQNKPLIIN